VYEKYECDNNILIYFSSQDGRSSSYAIGVYDNLINTLTIKQ